MDVVGEFEAPCELVLKGWDMFRQIDRAVIMPRLLVVKKIERN